MDVTFPVLVAAMSLAAAYAGYRAGNKRGRPDHHELNKIGKLLRAPRQRGEGDEAYAARLAALMQQEVA